MGVGAFLEPLIVVSLLTGGTIFNRNNSPPSSSSSSPVSSRPNPWRDLEYPGALEAGPPSHSPKTKSRSSSISSFSFDTPREKYDPRYRQRTLRFFNWEREITTPNTEIFKDRLLSRLLRALPFLVEVWYWALVYWVYQLGRAFSAVTLKDSTVDTARKHALQVVAVEEYLQIFIEADIQKWFRGHPVLMQWTNRTYSFIHIPGTILFLIVLYYITTARPKRILLESYEDDVGGRLSPRQWRQPVTRMGPDVYQRRRRTMAMCNLLAFVVFTFWPCMPPRLLSDPTYNGPDAAQAKSYGFVDTVHGVDGDSSVWTTNRFCNQYAAMPSLHFGYSFLIGLTIATAPMAKRGRMAWRRLALVSVGMVYPAIILAAIVATANHFILDAVAGVCACLLAWKFNGFLLNLLPLEDYFLSVLRIHKP
ncbi:PAP2 superfamily-domain-containing protein [Lasiosphaeria ovina]|uniref:PAP2 superfamily-domain-containing protein n=1 Tax=Lasiosphaeria ovina TaxID=92902 RepID=A0AAE0JYN3_9PEZI|nr:PAP2 superfamily-domain-containing protein [Lasiosphaeria ovina]